MDQVQFINERSLNLKIVKLEFCFKAKNVKAMVHSCMCGVDTQRPESVWDLAPENFKGRKEMPE